MGPRMRLDMERRAWVDDRTPLRRFAEDAAEAVLALAGLAAILLTWWLWLAMTPPQASAQCDLLRAEMEAMETAPDLGICNTP